MSETFGSKPSPENQPRHFVVESILDKGDTAEYEKSRDAFIADRLATLESTAQKRDHISLGSREMQTHRGFIHPETEVKRVFFLDGFMLDDQEVYAVFLDKMKEMKKTPGWKDVPTKALVPYAVQYALGDYFGNYLSTSSTNNRNKAFYSDRSDSDSEKFSVKELRDKKIAVCVEKSALAQNLFSFAGLESELALSGNCQLQEEKNEDGHAFNVLTSAKGNFIFDTTNPELVFDKEGSIVATYPAIYSLTPEEKQAFDRGEGVTVQHVNRIREGSAEVKQPPQPRVYKK